MLIQLFTKRPDQIITIYESYLECCEKTSADSFAIVLLQNGVYAYQFLKNIIPETNLFVLETDFRASGLIEDTGIQFIDDERWVALCAAHAPVMSVQDE